MARYFRLFVVLLAAVAASAFPGLMKPTAAVLVFMVRWARWVVSRREPLVARGVVVTATGWTEASTLRVRVRVMVTTR